MINNSLIYIKDVSFKDRVNVDDHLQGLYFGLLCNFLEKIDFVFSYKEFLTIFLVVKCIRTLLQLSIILFPLIIR